jgi:hypothetical protein
MSIKNNLFNIKSTLPEHVTLVAVSKTNLFPDLMELMMLVNTFLEKTKSRKWPRNGNKPKDIQSVT